MVSITIVLEADVTIMRHDLELAEFFDFALDDSDGEMVEV